MGNQKL